MLKIRLQKVGKKNAPSYRVVLAEHTSPPQGKFIEILGNYNPRLKQKNFKKERIEHWLEKGAQPSPTVYNLLIDAKIIEAEKLRAWKAKAKKEKAEKPKEPTPEKTEEPKTEGPEPEEKLDQKAEQAEASREEEKPEERVEPSPSDEGDRVDKNEKID